MLWSLHFDDVGTDAAQPGEAKAILWLRLTKPFYFGGANSVIEK
jgi:hypothetical protein